MNDDKIKLQLLLFFFGQLRQLRPKVDQHFVLLRKIRFLLIESSLKPFDALFEISNALCNITDRIRELRLYKGQNRIIFSFSCQTKTVDAKIESQPVVPLA